MDQDQPSADTDLLVLYLERRAQLVRFFTARTGSPSEAEDIVQDMYAKVAAANPDELAEPMAYLYRIGTNVLLDRVRTRRRAEARDGSYVSAHNVAAGAEMIAPEPSAEAAVAARQQLRALLAEVDQLPPQCRTVFKLHKLENLSYADVAARLGISRSGVEKHMMAALRRLARFRP